MNDRNKKRFRFSLANLLLAMAPVAIACLPSAPLIRYGFWPAALPFLVFGISIGIGALCCGLAGLWRGFVCGWFVIILLFVVLSLIGLPRMPLVVVR